MKVECPDSCCYRQKEAPVCGFCLKKILEDIAEEKEDGGEEDGPKK